MEEDMRKDLKEIHEEFMQLRQDVNECKTDIAVNRQEIQNINTRHIPPNIRSKLCSLLNLIKITYWGRRVRDRMIVGFRTTYAISTNHH